MNRRSLLSALPSLALVATVTPSLRDAFAAPTLPKVEVYKTPTCGCCGAWVEHMRAAGRAFAAESLALGFPDYFSNLIMASSSTEATAVVFTPIAVFEQTPGPKAGTRLEPRS